MVQNEVPSHSAGVSMCSMEDIALIECPFSVLLQPQHPSGGSRDLLLVTYVVSLFSQ